LVECPKCGAKASTPIKTWSLPSRRQSKTGEETKVQVGIFECTECKAKFRAAVEPQPEPMKEEAADANIQDMVDRIKGIKGELMLTLRNLRDKIKTLETERANLMLEIDELRKVAESRVNALDSEVSMLREEVKSLRDLLGYSEEKE
jgi:vacuolar-type H+-ATPase subunit I/STV1